LVLALLLDLEVIECATVEHILRFVQTAWTQECGQQINQAKCGYNEALHAYPRRGVLKGNETLCV